MAMASAEEFVRTAAQRLTSIKEASERGDSSVQQFYRGAVVLVTGGAGFLGKSLVEKLLRTCDVKKVYLLLRCHRGTTAEQRLHDMLDNPVFETVRDVDPGFANKIQVVAGDVTHTKLGMAEDTWAELTETVTVVFHCAATLSFVEPLRQATKTNVKGTFEMLNFGNACKNLRAFVHVSSAYTQAVASRHLTEVPEQFSSSPVFPGTLVDIASKITHNGPEDPFTQQEIIYNEKALDDICAKYIGKEYPNTYTFTKAVAEEAVRTMSGDIPVCIVRPTGVISSYTEPTPAWIDDSNGFSSHILNMLYGTTHATLADPTIKADLVPVDLVSNALLAAAWDTARRSQRGEKETKIYTIGSSYRNPVKWGYILSVFYNEIRQHLSPTAARCAFVLHTTSTRLYSVLALLLHVLPAYGADAALQLVGKRPIIAKLHKKANVRSEIFSYFLLHSWDFLDDNLLQMHNRMSATDRQLFNVDIASVDMTELIVLWNISIRKYILKKTLGGEAMAMKIQFIFTMATLAMAPVYFFILYKLFSFVINLFLLNK